MTQRKNACIQVLSKSKYVQRSPNTDIYRLHKARIWKFSHRANQEKLSQMPYILFPNTFLETEKSSHSNIFHSTFVYIKLESTTDSKTSTRREVCTGSDFNSDSHCQKTFAS